jgi:hypothetical protein
MTPNQLIALLRQVGARGPVSGPEQAWILPSGALDRLAAGVGQPEKLRAGYKEVDIMNVDTAVLHGVFSGAASKMSSTARIPSRASSPNPPRVGQRKHPVAFSDGYVEKPNARHGRSSSMGKRLYVGNLAYSVRDNDLERAFSQYGSVASAKVMMERDTDRSKGFGFVEMGTDAEALAAIEGLNGQSLGSRSGGGRGGY